MAWSAVDESVQGELEKALSKHEASHPVPTIKTTEGRIVEEGQTPIIVEPDDVNADVDSDAA